MMVDLLEYLFPMRDERGATLQLLTIVLVLLIPCLWLIRKCLLRKVIIVARRPIIKRIATAGVLFCIGVVAYVPLYNYVLQPSGKFWAARVDVITILLSVHRAEAFWTLFAVYLVVLLIVCAKWCNIKIRRDAQFEVVERIAPGHDAPIKRIPDTEKDRSSFVKVIAEAVARADIRHEAEFIGIYGEWGSGKTTVANSLKDNILRGLVQYKGLENICFVSFNPMEYQGATDALTGLFKEIVAQLKKKPELRRLAKAFNAYSTSLCMRRVKIGLGTIGEMIEMMRQWIYLKVFRSIKSKQRLRLELRSAQIRLILIVDDLERLPCKDVYSIINFLKANVDLPNVVVLILADREHLYRSMADAVGYENASEADKLKAGKLYLAKFVQRPLEVPRFSRSAIVEYFKSKLPEVLMDVEVPDYKDDCATVADFAGTMRQVNTILGRMWAAVRYYCHYTGGTTLPYHVGDLAALTAIAEVEPNVYNNLSDLMHRVWAESDLNAVNPDWGIPESVLNKWIDENVIHRGDRQFVKAFLIDRLSFIESKDKERKVIYRIDVETGKLESTYSFRLASPSWFNLYFGDFSGEDVASPDDLLAFNRCISEMTVPEELLQRKIKDNSLVPLLDALLGQTEFESEKELEIFIKTLLWLSCQKYGPQYFSNLSDQGFYASTVYMSIYRDWLSYWTRVVKNSPAVKKKTVGDLIVKLCKENPACHFIRQLLSNDSPNHKKGVPEQVLELSMFTDAQYEKLVDLYLDAVQELQVRDRIFDDPCYLDLLRAWNITLIRRNDSSRYEKFRTSIEMSLGNVTNILKLRLFFIRSAIFAGDGEKIVDDIYFNGVDLEVVKRLFGLRLIKQIALKLQGVYDSLSLEDKILSAALSFVSGRDLDPVKCSPGQQIEHLRDVFSSPRQEEMPNDKARSVIALREDFMGAISKYEFAQQLAALAMAYQVKAIEKREDTIDMGHGLYVQTHEQLVRDGEGELDTINCPVFVYDASRIVRDEDASNGEYLSASLHVSLNYLVPLAKLICSDKGNTYGAFEFLVGRNKLLDPSRREQCAKALYYGALGDYSSAAQLLFPQIEHLIRAMLKANGMNVQQGYGVAKGLGALLRTPNIKKIMPKVLRFELMALFTSNGNGLNIRNLFAHGQVSDSESVCLETFYIWWFFLRIVVSLSGESIDMLSDE